MEKPRECLPHTLVVVDNGQRHSLKANSDRLRRSGKGTLMAIPRPTNSSGLGREPCCKSMGTLSREGRDQSSEQVIKRTEAIQLMNTWIPEGGASADRMFPRGIGGDSNDDDRPSASTSVRIPAALASECADERQRDVGCGRFRVRSKTAIRRTVQRPSVHLTNTYALAQRRNCGSVTSIVRVSAARGRFCRDNDGVQPCEQRQ
jgi:hypothetical protein